MVELPNIFFKSLYILYFHKSLMKRVKNHYFEALLQIFCNIRNVFTVYFEPFNAFKSFKKMMTPNFWMVVLM